MTLTNANLYSEGYTLVKNFLNGIAGLDPKDRAKANWIHATPPSVNGKAFDGYPYMVLRVDVSEDKKSFNPAVSEKIFRVLISVYSNEPTDIDTICDSINSALKTETNLTDFGSKEISSSPFQWDTDDHGKKICFRNLGFIMRSRI